MAQWRGFRLPCVRYLYVLPGAGKRQEGAHASPFLTSPRPAGRASLRDAFRRPCPRDAPARLALPAQPGLSPLPAAHAGVTGTVSALYAGTCVAASQAVLRTIASLWFIGMSARNLHAAKHNDRQWHSDKSGFTKSINNQHSVFSVQHIIISHLPLAFSYLPFAICHLPLFFSLQPSANVFADLLPGACMR